jgi:hypothetical protein
MQMVLAVLQFEQMTSCPVVVGVRTKSCATVRGQRARPPVAVEEEIETFPSEWYWTVAAATPNVANTRTTNEPMSFFIILLRLPSLSFQQEQRYPKRVPADYWQWPEHTL